MKRASTLLTLTLTAITAVAIHAASADIETWVAPPDAATIKNPHAQSANTANKGKELFTQQCVPCHGESGKGDGPAGKFLGRPLPDFTTTDFQKQADGELFWKIATGRAPMPTFKDILSDEQRWLVTSYLRTFRTTEQQGGAR